MGLLLSFANVLSVLPLTNVKPARFGLTNITLTHLVIDAIAQTGTMGEIQSPYSIPGTEGDEIIWSRDLRRSTNVMLVATLCPPVVGAWDRYHWVREYVRLPPNATCISDTVVLTYRNQG